MNIIATTRFALHITCSVVTLLVLSLLLFAPMLIPKGTGVFVIAISLLGSVMLGVFALLRSKGTVIANDELARASEKSGYAFGYYVSSAIFLIFLACSLAGQLDPKTAFYFMAFPLAAAPSLYMVVAFLRGRAG